MSKKNNFDDEILVDRPDMGCYYHTDMFRYPEEELMRPQPPMKAAPMKTPHMMTPSMTPSMMPSMTPMDESMPMSPTLTNIGYTQAYLRTIIGKHVRVSFLIGSMLTDRTGTLLQVGISYIVLKQADTNINIMCDLYSIKFVDILNP